MSTAAAPARARAFCWRAARITPLTEVLVASRVTARAIRLAVQVLLTVALWRGLYANTASSAGLGREQAVQFAVLAALLARLRYLDRSDGRDDLLQHVQSGTVLYWFLRPMPPRRYHAVRAAGDQLYGAIWFAVAVAACLAAGVLALPGGPRLAVAGVSLLLGQLIVYRLALLVDLSCFWMMQSHAVRLVFALLQNLLAGVYAPLWFFPHWFRFVASLLPFHLTVNVPLSLYVGRLPLADAPQLLAVQLGWAAALTIVTSRIWARVPSRLSVQGG